MSAYGEYDNRMTRLSERLIEITAICNSLATKLDEQNATLAKIAAHYNIPELGKRDSEAA